MKRCSTCSRTYTDPNLSFCIDDGTPLTPVESEDESTVVSPRERENAWSGAAYQPPGSYVRPGTPPRRRRVWPWVLGILGAFVLGIVAISIAAAILVPRWIRSAQTERASRTAEPRNTNSVENSSSREPANSNIQPNNDTDDGNIDTPPPTDHDQVLAQLNDLEHEWTVANLNADKQKLDRILADDYVGPSAEGGLETKGEYIQTIRRDTDVQKFEFDDLKLKLAGDRATLSGKITYETQDRELVLDFTDKFVWRDGRWQATGSEVKPRE